MTQLKEARNIGPESGVGTRVLLFVLGVAFTGLAFYLSLH